MLIDRFRYKKTLMSLWRRVFGDEYSYIELIFYGESGESIICFAELTDGEAVSAFYLLKSEIHFEGKVYNGYYLYSAATDENHRGKGIMSKLIREAQLYCKDNGYDFISLVPAEKSLYDYYGRFGFVNAMYCLKLTDTVSDGYSPVDPEAYLSYRKSFLNNYFTFDEKSFLYAAACLQASGYGFFSNGENVKIKGAEGDVIELLGSELTKYGCCEKYSFGMLCPLKDDLERPWKHTDIYMNIALD